MTNFSLWLMVDPGLHLASDAIIAVKTIFLSRLIDFSVVMDEAASTSFGRTFVRGYSRHRPPANWTLL